MRYTACMGRSEVDGFIPPNNSVLISLSDPDRDDPSVQPGWEDILRLKFWDVDTRMSYPKIAVGAERLAIIPGRTDISAADYHYFDPATPQQLQQIIDFINKHFTCNVFAHCEAGISRSAAVREFLVRRGWKYYGSNQRRGVYPNAYILSSLERIDRGIELC